MAVTIDSTEILKQYFNDVLVRAEHHAKEVKSVALTLLGAVVWKSQGEIKVMETKIGYGNVLWFETPSGRYAMSYNHKDRKIDMRQHSIKGETLYQFDNNTPQEFITALFESM